MKVIGIAMTSSKTLVKKVGCTVYPEVKKDKSVVVVGLDALLVASRTGKLKDKAVYLIDHPQILRNVGIKLGDCSEEHLGVYIKKPLEVPIETKINLSCLHGRLAKINASTLVKREK